MINMGGTVQLYEKRVQALLETKQLTEAQQQLQRIRQTRAEFFNILKYACLHSFTAKLLGITIVFWTTLA